MITIKTEKEIELMRQGGKILAQILRKLAEEVRPGVTTGHLEQMACALIFEAGARPAFKGYKTSGSAAPYPTALCTSINNEIVHGPAMPSRTLNSGDIVGLDLGIEFPFKENSDGKKIRGLYTDAAVTVGVGKISKEAQKLINVTRAALTIGIKKIKPGNTLNDLGSAIEEYVESQGFSIVRELVGHGVGRAIHEDPQIPNYDCKYEKIVMKSGMTLAIEPMVNTGDWPIKNGEDGHTIITEDNSLSAHFEHTVVVTDAGYEILTKV